MIVRRPCRARDAAQRLCDELTPRGLAVDALVNNAGYGVPGTFLVPVVGAARRADAGDDGAFAELTYRLLPAMIERRYGRIINVASLAGLVPAPGGHTLYGAPKAFVIRYSEALAHEVRRRGRARHRAVSRVHAQRVSRSHRHARARQQAAAFLWMDAATVARQGYDAVMAGRSVYVNGLVNRTIAALASCLPNGIVTMVSRRSARLYRK